MYIRFLQMPKGNVLVQKVTRTEVYRQNLFSGVQYCSFGPALRVTRCRITPQQVLCDFLAGSFRVDFYDSKQIVIEV